MSQIHIPESFVGNPYAEEQFRNIVQWAKSNHPFYQQWIPENADTVPILTRDVILDNNLKLLNGHPVTGKTTGSTGVPVEVSWSDQRTAVEQKVTERFVAWLGGRLSGTRIIHVTPEHTGDEYLDVNNSVNVQVETILQRYQNVNATSLTTYPTNAERLCRAVIEQDLDMGFIERFGCYAEVFEPYHESLIKKAFPNAKIWTTYSATEVGMIAARCPHDPKFHHMFTGKLGIEVLNDNGVPCALGEVGRLVITDFFNTNAPLIRYEIGDLIVRGECSCGKIDFPALEHVLGKVRGALVHKNGERVPFTWLSYALREITGMRQYQVIQHELERFELRYVVNLFEKDEANFHECVKNAFMAHFEYLPNIEFTREESIERGKNGKFYASISHV